MPNVLRNLTNAAGRVHGYVTRWHRCSRIRKDTGGRPSPARLASLPYGLRIAALSSFLKAVVDRRPASIICRLIVDTRTYTKLNGAPDDIFCVNGGPHLWASAPASTSR